jgi:hypothetical protein
VSSLATKLKGRKYALQVVTCLQKKFCFEVAGHYLTHPNTPAQAETIESMCYGLLFSGWPEKSWTGILDIILFSSFPFSARWGWAIVGAEGYLQWKIFPGESSYEYHDQILSISFQ